MFRDLRFCLLSMKGNALEIISLRTFSDNDRVRVCRNYYLYMYTCTHLDFLNRNFAIKSIFFIVSLNCKMVYEYKAHSKYLNINRWYRPQTEFVIFTV